MIKRKLRRMILRNESRISLISNVQADCEFFISKMPLDLNGEWVLVKNNEMERYFSEFGKFG